MALDSGVTAEDMASVKYFFGGGAPFSPDLQDEFEKAYDLKVVWAYGATEFCGTIISWTPRAVR
jgi:long-chain acyl-CoA synthetase